MMSHVNRSKNSNIRFDNKCHKIIGEFYYYFSVELRRIIMIG